MADKPEVKVKKMIKAMFHKVGAYYAMPIGTGYGSSGVPDFLVCHRGRFIAVEAKAGNNHPTALQWKNLHDITKAGGISLVINESNLHDLERVLNADDTSNSEKAV